MTKENLTIEQRLDKIEKLLISNKEVLTFEEFCIYCGFSDSHGYKLTSGRKVKHYCPTGKMNYFKKDDVIKWLLQNPIKTAEEIESEAATYVTLKKKGV